MSDVAPVRGRWYAVFALTMLTTLAYIDRQALSLLAEPIKHDLHLTDTQLSLLLGLSFAIFHTLTTLPFGWLVDRYNRRNLVIAGSLAWSAFTISCGFARGFWGLFVGRAGVGFSEGGIGPASFSMIRDYFPPEKRGKAFGIYAISAPLGGALSFIVAGGILAVASGHGPQSWPVIGVVQPWQMVLIVIGSAGLPLAALMLPVREPPRTEAARSDYSEATGYIWSNRSIYIPLILFGGFYAMISAAFGAWIPAMIVRNFHLSLPQVGAMLGLVLIIAPSAGIMTGGALIDRLHRRGVANGAAIVGVAASVLVAIPSVVAPLAPNIYVFIPLLAATLYFSGFVFPVLQVVAAHITPPRLSGKVFALHTLPQALLGAAVGPTLVGLASDYLFTGPRALAHALSTSAALYVTIAALAGLWLLFASRRFDASQTMIGVAE